MSLHATRIALVAVGLCIAAPAWSEAPDRTAVTTALQKIVDDYLATNALAEGLTAVSASVSLPGGHEPNINVVAGLMSKVDGAPAITPDTLFPIGSITKSMTSTVILQLVGEGVLSLDAPIGRWLPEYPGWKDVTLRRLLDMTSGIPSYDQTDAFLRAMARGGIGRFFTPEVLISFTDPDLPGAPAPTTGFNYANVNYVIAEMIVERATGRSLDDHVRQRLLSGGHGLDATYYSSVAYPDSVLSRTVSSYMIADTADDKSGILDPLYGIDLKAQDPSWARGAGAAIATPEDVTRWVRLLYTGDVLTEAQRTELTKLVSMTTGMPVAAATAEDRRAFGLGVGQTIVDDVRFWFYEGEPLGARMFYGYFPERDLVIVIAVNSAGDTDALGPALIAAYEAVTGDTVNISPPKK
jgi:D-alanyl-D-alanine carboxypeptidase